MRHSLVLLVVFIGLAAAVMSKLSSSDTNEWNSDLKFSHKLHVTDNEIECSNCHEGVEESTTGADDLLPTEETCMQCHEKNDETCGDCHSTSSPKKLSRIKNYNKKFSHKKHLKQGFKCNNCHKGIPEKETIAGMLIPKMDDCMKCHEQPESKNDCYTCHSEGDDLLPPDHTMLWKTNHGSFKESSGKRCSTCHSDDFCIECHEGENLFNEAHPPEFIMTHPMSYLSRESDCASCHGGFEFCVDCHVNVNYIVPPDHNFTSWYLQHRIEGRVNHDVCVTCHLPNDPNCFVSGCHTEE